MNEPLSSASSETFRHFVARPGDRALDVTVDRPGRRHIRSYWRVEFLLGAVILVGTSACNDVPANGEVGDSESAGDGDGDPTGDGDGDPAGDGDGDGDPTGDGDPEDGPWG